MLWLSKQRKLFQCLIKKGIPIQICKIIFQIYQDTKYFIRSGDFLAESFTTTTGVPQGCKLSSILFSLYVANLPKCLHKKGPKLGNALINHLQYSDDLALIGRTANELQLHLDKIEKHCSEIELEINIKKTKIQIFYKGRLPNNDKEFNFKLNGETLEVVKEFKYLGMSFTTQLSFSKHLESVIVKAQSKIGMVYSKFKNLQLKLP